MSEPLLRTKLYVPPLRPNHVPRLQLLERFYQEMHRRRKLTLVSAPAGSGMTTLLSQLAAGSSLLLAWLSLDEADNDPRRFWAYLIDACQSVRPGTGESALALLNATQSLPADTIPTLLINGLLQQQQAILLVLGDYHVIQNSAVHDSLLFLLDYLPHHVHVIIATRSDPHCPLARYRTRNQLFEIRAHDLRFNSDEAAHFLNESMGLDLPADTIAVLQERTEGWVAGLQLAALAMQSLISAQGREGLPTFIQNFGGSHLYVAEYLLEEVLKHQSDEVHTFLLQTSLLERLSAELCAAVTNGQSSRTLLTTLHRTNLFAVPLDGEGRWFRYHHLLADLLRARLLRALPRDEVSNLHLRAAAWFERNGAFPDAVDHLLAARAYEDAAQLLDQQARALMSAGKASALRTWLEALPTAYLQAHPRLTIYKL